MQFLRQEFLHARTRKAGRITRELIYNWHQNVSRSRVKYAAALVFMHGRSFRISFRCYLCLSRNNLIMNSLITNGLTVIIAKLSVINKGRSKRGKLW